MSAKWESIFSTWAKGPGTAEQERCDNTIRAIKNAIAKDQKLSSKSLKVFVQGSYRNNVNISQSSDVDIGVVCNDLFYPEYPEGKSKEDFGVVDSSYSISEFRTDLYNCMQQHFGALQVKLGSKAISINNNTYRVEADVVPLVEFRKYWDSGSYRAGVVLLDAKQNKRIQNYPERLFSYWPETPLHYENGVAKNTACGRTFKSVVRIVKHLSNQMAEAGYDSAKRVPSYLIECMFYNCPNSTFNGSTWYGNVCSALSMVEQKADDSWTEVDGIKYLFHLSQPWTYGDVKSFVLDAQQYLK